MLKPSNVLEVANATYQPSYLSFTYCLGKLGILNQIAYEIEFANRRKTKRIELKGRDVVFRKIKKFLTMSKNILLKSSGKHGNS
jgi:hypothetical protein